MLSARETEDFTLLRDENNISMCRSARLGWLYNSPFKNKHIHNEDNIHVKL